LKKRCAAKTNSYQINRFSLFGFQKRRYVMPNGGLF